MYCYYFKSVTVSKFFPITVVRQVSETEVSFTRDMVVDQEYQDVYENMSHPDTQALIAQAEEAVNFEISLLKVIFVFCGHPD